jgi:hypothetical protein
MTDASPPDASARPNWWTLMSSGADNATPAIGRVLGVLLFICCFAILPAFILGVGVAQHVKFADLIGILPMVAAYVLAIVTAIVGLIRVTAPTEPKAPSQ